MITRKELEYVNSWANKVPYPGIEYATIALDKLEESFKLYNNVYKDVKYNISFSNNEEIEFAILAKNICHMLGIDFKNLSSEYFKEFRKKTLDIDPEIGISSYDLLESIINHKKEILKSDIDASYKAINYYLLAIKCDIFRKLSNLSKFNYGCINFDKNEFMKHNPDSKYSSNSTKFFYTDSNETVSPCYLMGLKIDEVIKSNYDDEEESTIIKDTNLYIVETLIASEVTEKFFNNQEVIIPTQILTNTKGTLSKKTATAAEKKKLLADYKALICEYNLPNKVNIYGDYLNMLNNSQNSETTSKIRKKPIV